jgi:indole-3-glycerol phosphate synthase/phosphoribosylanthranilate isomerase
MKVEPGGVLGEIVARKRVDVAARLEGVTLDDIRARAQPTQRSLAEALSRPGARFVMEVKHTSPSKGASAGHAPEDAARAYADVADAISVLTDAPYFGGSFEDLVAVRDIFDGPVLCKDFTVDVRQVAEARIHGADAVLVMLSVLDDETAAACLAEVERFGMSAIVEVHDEAEMRRAAALGARIIGINNRDLKTLTTDLAVTERLAPIAPEGAILVSESGIAEHGDVLRLAPLVDAFLVGSSLMAQADIHGAARRLVHGRVKVCGLTRANDIAEARRLGASFGGLIFAEGSPRQVTREQAVALAAAAMMPLVGVFQNAPAEQVADLAATLGLAAVQLHGGEDEDYVEALRPLLPDGTEIWTAIPVSAEIKPGASFGDRALFDTQAGNAFGGTGRAFDWGKVIGRPDFPASLLAGGLGPANAAAAARVGAWAIDVNSSVEDAPGIKSAEKLAALFEALRPAVRGEGSC